MRDVDTPAKRFTAHRNRSRRSQVVQAARR